MRTTRHNYAMQRTLILNSLGVRPTFSLITIVFHIQIDQGERIVSLDHTNEFVWRTIDWQTSVYDIE